MRYLHWKSKKRQIKQKKKKDFKSMENIMKKAKNTTKRNSDITNLHYLFHEYREHTQQN